MPLEPNEILNAALDLAPADRARLVDEIMASFGPPRNADIEAKWAAEAEARIDAYNRGEIAAIPAAEVFRRIQTPTD